MIPDSDIRLHKCRRIIDTVTDHRYLMPFQLELFDYADFFLGQQLGVYFVNPNIVSDRFSHCPAIAR